MLAASFILRFAFLTAFQVPLQHDVDVLGKRAIVFLRELPDALDDLDLQRQADILLHPLTPRHADLCFIIIENASNSLLQAY